MFCWRITKYNPQNRDAEGNYVKDEWTSYSDIGKKFASERLLLEQYLQVENAYIQAISYFMDCLRLNDLRINHLEKYSEPTIQEGYSEVDIDTYRMIEDGQSLTQKQVVTVAKLALRENLWSKLESESMYVHFGYDYYLYIGSKSPCRKVIKRIEETGLFVEKCQSPYL